MSAKYRVFSPEFKKSVAQRVLNGESVSSLRHELDIKRAVLYRWRDTYRKEGSVGFERPLGRPPARTAALGPKTGPEAAAQRRIAELERKIGQLTMENDFLKKALQHFRDHHPPAVVSGADACLKKSATLRKKAKR